ncbi:MAG: Crp/Fnr family transcriptional regulator [Deltaproteobacteria bacterium]|nr:Crp/Fnr family transcriptional regulator [Deltaproteobacteria bacterium]
MSEAQLYSRFGKQFPAGTVLFRQGEPGSEMYVIQGGLVRISVAVREVEKTLIDLGPGEFFGEMSILNNQPRSATATVIEDAKLLVIDSRTFEAMVRGSADVAIRMIKKLAARLQEADDQISNLMHKDQSSRVVHGILALCRKASETERGLRVETTLEALGTKIGVERQYLRIVVDGLANAGLVEVEPDAMYVGDVEKLREFLEFLAMKEKFGLA